MIIVAIFTFVKLSFRLLFALEEHDFCSSPNTRCKKHMYVLLNLKLKITQFHDLNLKSALNTCITNTNIMDIWLCTTGIKSDPSH